MSVKKTHNQFIEEMNDVNKNLEILGKYTCAKDNILCKCKIDGYEWSPTANNLLRGLGCPVCAGQRLVDGINSIYDTDKWMCEYIADKKDCHKYMSSAKRKILLKCPNCNNEKFMYIYNLKNRGFSCNVCGDGYPYTEKFMSSVLNQLNIKYKQQLNKKDFGWCEKYRYDFYLKNYNCIIETHGISHYENCGFSSVGGKTLTEEQKNDKIKKNIAINNGILEYIVLDFRYSNKDWVKNSIMSSKLPKLLKFKEEDIDWVKCEKYAMTSNMVNVCKLWDSGKFESTKALGEYTAINRFTVIRYLKRGNDIGICTYDPKIEHEKGVRKNRNAKNNVEVFKDGVSLGVFYSAGYIEKHSIELFGVKLYTSSIFKVCKGERKSSKGYIFVNKSVDKNIELKETWN